MKALLAKSADVNAISESGSSPLSAGISRPLKDWDTWRPWAEACAARESYCPQARITGLHDTIKVHSPLLEYEEIATLWKLMNEVFPQDRPTYYSTTLYDLSRALPNAIRSGKPFVIAFAHAFANSGFVELFELAGQPVAMSRRTVYFQTDGWNLIGGPTSTVYRIEPLGNTTDSFGVRSRNFKKESSGGRTKIEYWLGVHGMREPDISIRVPLIPRSPL